MDIVKFAISKPVAIAVGLILIVLFGVISLTRLPYQLTPDVSRPEISVITRWSGATPYEIESEVVEPQEKVLKNIENLEEYESSSSTGSGRITLRFKLGTNLQKALLDTSNKLSEVRNYPDNVDKPVLRATGETVPVVIWMMVQTLEGNERDIATYQTFLEDKITEQFERIQGVSELTTRGGINDEIHITIDPMRLAAMGLTIDSVINAIGGENIDVSAGTLDLGRRSYRVRTASKYQTPESAGETILLSDGHKRVLLKDVATIELGNAKKTGGAIFMGKSGLAIGVRPEAGTNVVEMTNKVEETVERLNKTILKDNGIEIVWNYDQRPYILGAIDLVKQNIIFGAVLAVIVLLIFLRSITPTLVVSIAIPLSVIGTFIILNATGRSLNIISLAGISFAVGMLVDSAIVVLENIDRHKRMGKPFLAAAYDGTLEVWGALIISALTTIAVFAPIIFLEDEAGQLFKDIAIAVTAAIAFSLAISVLAIPMLWRQMMRMTKVKEHNPSGIAAKIGVLGTFLRDFFMGLLDLIMRNHLTRFGTIGVLTFIVVVFTWVTFPKMEYLPEGNQNLVQNMFVLPPGLSYAESRHIGDAIFEKIMPYTKEEKDGYPQIARAFFNHGGSWMFMGVSAVQIDRASELIPLLRPIVNSFPGVRAITKQAGVFERGMGSSRSVNVDVTAETLDEIADYAERLMNAIGGGISGSQIRPVPAIELIYPEVTIAPRSDRLKAVGMDARSLGIAADVLLDGRKVSEYQGSGIKKIDLILRAKESAIAAPEDLGKSPIATPKGQIVPLSELGEVKLGQGITEIRHFQGRRTITLQVSPPREITIQEAMEKIDEITPSVLAGNDKIEVRLSGTADKLIATVDALKWNFILAVFITYLLMSALFGNFIYPLIILFTVPLATAGGFFGLKMTNWFIAPQPFDILTMLGFIILVGIVVNNAILIVHQSLNFIRNDAMGHLEAIKESVRTRLRPIYMSALTSVCGMSPLVLAPGPGSEMYRGLGSVITGGLMVSTIFTVFAIPALLIYVIKWEKPRKIEE
ncbi:MAG: efflux RND transporter permease subunit [Helicobacteraceae bacterium]|jgi:HAE1 family hydrophobic/amphiphilic exporter-1|nr:efflux RND transporter permease subunit [Helicobacteraceae bacterium]